MFYSYHYINYIAAFHIRKGLQEIWKERGIVTFAYKLCKLEQDVVFLSHFYFLHCELTHIGVILHRNNYGLKLKIIMD